MVLSGLSFGFQDKDKGSLLNGYIAMVRYAAGLTCSGACYPLEKTQTCTKPQHNDQSVLSKKIPRTLVCR